MLAKHETQIWKCEQIESYILFFLVCLLKKFRVNPMFEMKVGYET